jgi:hypothetical protein
LLDELKYNINLKMHYIGDKQVRLGHKTAAVLSG